MEGHKYVLVRARIHSPGMAVVHARAKGFNSGHVTFTRAQVGLVNIHSIAKTLTPKKLGISVINLFA